ncbi:iron hydrogenase [Gloeopeniophorella convolvens]|nr:iron hydrogenase [Gloeopeniophorella convolvens]
MAFSGALTLTDLNDYITPAQACIKPVEQTNAPKARTPGDAATEIRIDANGAYYEVGADSSSSAQKLQPAEVSLNDCLACSGCITSAESVLITLQSHTEVLSVLRANPAPGAPGHRVPVLSIAPQSLASLAATLSPTPGTPIPLPHMLRRVQAFAQHTLGFAHVFDTTFARELALREHTREFFERRERAQAGGALPMLASACPGWVCYAEKTHGEMLPFIAGTKSPQQVMGTLVKEWLAPRRWNKRPDEVYHVTVMPCYDKKLEASRTDFYNAQYATRDVDCVLTTGELLRLAREHGVDLAAPAADEILPPRAPPLLPELLTPPGSSSGSYLHTLMQAVALATPAPLTLESKTLRSADYTEHTLRDGAGTPVFRGATCYGFRNLQNVVRRVGRGAGVQVGRGAAGRLAGGLRARAGEPPYDYVEVMACPGGCVGGGGQLRPPSVDAEGLARDWAAEGVRPEAGAGTGASSGEAPWSSRAWTREVERAYWGGAAPAPALPTPPASPRLGGADKAAGVEPAAAAVEALVARVLRELCVPAGGGAAGWDAAAEERRRALFRTQYRAVESEVVGLGVKW